METAKEFDIWAADDGAIKATPAETRFVDDSDSPYGYSKHQVRLCAETARCAIREYQKVKKV